jgi:hypothetical protein
MSDPLDRLRAAPLTFVPRDLTNVRSIGGLNSLSDDARVYTYGLSLYSSRLYTVDDLR